MDMRLIRMLEKEELKELYGGDCGWFFIDGEWVYCGKSYENSLCGDRSNNI